MAQFNYDEAKKAGYSDDEIRQYLLEQKGVSEALGAGYSEDEVLQHFGFPEAAAVEQITGAGRLPAIAASGAAGGLAASLGLPGTAIEIGNALLPNVLTRPIFSITPEKGFQLFPEEEPVNFLPTMEQTTGFARQLGLVNRPDLTPQDKVEEYTSAIGEGIGASIPFLMSGGSPLAIMAGGATGGAGAETGEQLMPDSPWASIAGGVLGGLGGQGIVQMVERGLSGKSIAKELAKAKADFERLGAETLPAKFATQDLRESAKRAAGVNFEAAKQAAELQLQGITAASDAAIGSAATTLGKSATLQEAGTILQEQARKWVLGLPGKLANVWKPVDEAIPSDTLLELSAFRSALSDINKSAGTLEPLAAMLKPGLPKGLEKALASIDELGELAGEGSAFSWKDVQKLRSTLGDAMSDPTVLRDVGAANLDRLYATLTADMRSAAGDLGALPAFDAANNQSRQLYQVAEGVLSNVIAGAKASADDPLAEVVANKLLAGGKIGATNLTTLRAEMPEALNELAAAGLRVADWRKMAPEAKEALVTDPVLRSSIDDALGAAEKGKVSHADALKTASELKKKALDEATTAFQESTRTRQLALQSAKERLAKARLAAAAVEGPKVPFNRHLLEVIPGGTAAGVLGLNALGLPGSELVHGALGATAGALAPMVLRGGKRLLQTPGGLAGALAGAEVGANQNPLIRP